VVFHFLAPLGMDQPGTVLHKFWKH